MQLYSARKTKYLEVQKKAAELARRDPELYHFNVKALLWMGYLFLYGGLLIGLASLALTIAAFKFSFWLAYFLLKTKLWIFTGILSWSILHSFFTRLPPPDGIEVSPGSLPELEKEIEAIRLKTGAPPVHKIYINTRYNCSISQEPQLGLMFMHHNILHIGAPMMMAVTLDEFRAIIAHEMGHFTGQHGKFGAIVWVSTITWSRLGENLEGSWPASWFLGLFFNRYYPYFKAYSSIMQRLHEHEADVAAGLAVGSQKIASSLLRIGLNGRKLDENYYPNVYNCAKEKDTPPSDFYSGMETVFGEPIDPNKEEIWIREILNTPAEPGDVHPAVLQRIAGVGASPNLEEWTAPSAINLLSGRKRELLSEFDQQWAEENMEQCRQAHALWMKERAEMAALEKKLPELDAPHLAKLGYHNLNFGSKEKAASLFHSALKKDPGCPMANYHAGLMALKKGDGRGVEYLSRIADTLEFGADSLQEIINYYQKGKNQRQADVWQERLDILVDKLELAERERDYLDLDAKLCAADESDENKWLIAEAMESSGIKVAKLWYAKIDLEHFPDVDQRYVILAAHSMFTYVREKHREELHEALGELEISYYLLVKELDDKDYCKLVEKDEFRLI